MAKVTEKTAKNPISAGVKFFDESVSELKKVHLPTREETLKATLVVLVMLVIFASFLGLADVIVGKIMQAVLT